MAYVTGDIPVGNYDPNRLSNIGIGHGAIDAGYGYTYFDTKTGHEFSAVLGFTYNFKNPDTDYKNGIDAHLDYGISQFLPQNLQVGVVGYLYQQLTPDSGSGDHVGSFKSSVAGIGPQLGYLFDAGGTQGYLNVKGYYEFAAENRPDGWNVWLTLSSRLPPRLGSSRSSSSAPGHRSPAMPSRLQKAAPRKIDRSVRPRPAGRPRTIAAYNGICPDPPPSLVANRKRVVGSTAGLIVQRRRPAGCRTGRGYRCEEKRGWGYVRRHGVEPNGRRCRRDACGHGFWAAGPGG